MATTATVCHRKDLATLLDASKRADTGAKVGYLTNLWALVRAGEVTAPTMLDTLSSMARERDREVIEEQIVALTSISNSLVEDDVRERFQKYVSRLLLPTARRLGWDARANDSEDVRLLRRSVLSALALLTDDPWMAKEATRRAEKFFKDPDSVSSDTANIAMRMAARLNKRVANYDNLVALLERVKKPGQRIAVVQALSSLGNAEDLRRAFDLLMAGTIRRQDLVYALRGASANPDSRRVLVSWLEVNLEKLAERNPGFGAARMVGCTAPGVREKCTPQSCRCLPACGRQMGQRSRRLREALEGADLCIDLRSRQSSAVTEYLKKWR